MCHIQLSQVRGNIGDLSCKYGLTKLLSLCRNKDIGQIYMDESKVVMKKELQGLLLKK